MKKRGKHLLPIITSRPSTSYRCRESSANACEGGTRLSSTAAVNGFGDHGSSISGEFKENYLHPVSLCSSLDYQSQHSVPQNSIDWDAIRSRIAQVGDTIIAVEADSTNPSLLGLSATSSSSSQCQVMPTEPNLNRTASDKSIDSTLCGVEPSSVHEKTKKDPASNVQPNASSSERIPSAPKSRTSSLSTSPEKVASTKPQQQYQCPKCLLRFDRILAQLQHKCNPKSKSSASLCNWPSLKLFKCLECLEEFSDLEDKIRHTCNPQREIQISSILAVTDDNSSIKECGTCMSSHGTNWQGTPNDSVKCDDCSMVANNKHDMKLHRTNNHMKRKSKGNAKIILFRCLECCCAFHTDFKLKRHQQMKHSLKPLTVVSSDKVKGKSSRSLASESSSPTRTKAHPVVRESHHLRLKYDKQFKCGMCSFKYQQIGSLKNHIALHMGSDKYKRSKYPYMCRLCKARFQLSEELKMHASKKDCLDKRRARVIPTSIEKSKSSCAAEQVNDNSSITSKMEVSPTPVETNDGQRPSQKGARRQSLKCGFCNVTYDSDTTLQKHVRSHRNDIFENHRHPIICFRCREEFDSCVKLFLHVRRNECIAASTDTSQTDKVGRSDEADTPETIKQLKGSNISSGDAKISHRQYNCPHCSLIFLSSQILNVHLISSHPLMCDKEEAGVPRSFRDVEESSRSSSQEESPVVVLNTEGQINKSDEGTSNTFLATDQQDSEDTGDTNVSRRTEVYFYLCNICKIEFTSWAQLDEHRCATHPQKVKHLQLAVNRHGPDESTDDPINIIKIDYFYPCDICGRVFSFWRTLALHKKAKHQVRWMTARYSSPRKKSNQEIVEPPGTDFQNRSFTERASSRPPSGEPQTSTLDTHEYIQGTEGDLKQSTDDDHVCSLNNQQTVPCHNTFIQQHFVDVALETEAAISGEDDKWCVPNLSPSVKINESYKEDNSGYVHEEPKRTVEDLKISSVVSLCSRESQESAAWQRRATTVKTPIHPLKDAKNWQPISKELPVTVASSLPLHTREVLERPQITGHEQIVSPSFKVAKVLQENQDAFEYLVESVLSLGSSDQTNDFRAVSQEDQGLDERDAYSPGQPGRRGITTKISFREAKQIMKSAISNPNSVSFHCSICGKWFGQFKVFTNHIFAHCNAAVYSCAFCEIRSQDICSVLKHIITAHGFALKQPHLSTADTILALSQSFLPAGDTISIPVHDSGQEPFILSETPSNLIPSGEQQQPVYPRPLHDYVYKPSDLEISPKFDAQKGVFMCTLCPFRSNIKTRFIYHLRVHHKQHPYRCTHCYEMFSFIPDVQVHFFENHKQVTQTEKLQAGQTLHDPDLQLDGQFMSHTNISSSLKCQPDVSPDCGTEHSKVLNQPIGPEADSMALHNSSDTDKGPAVGLDTAMQQQQHRDSSTYPDCGPHSTTQEIQQIHNDEETLLPIVKVKQEKLTDDEADNPSCMVKESLLSVIKTEPGSHDERVDHADVNFTLCEDLTTYEGISGENQETCEPDFASSMQSSSKVDESESASETPSFPSSGKYRTPAENPYSPLQALNDLLKLASDMGITVTGSNKIEGPVGDATSSLENDSYRDGKFSPDSTTKGYKEGCMSLSDTDQGDKVESNMMASSDNDLSISLEDVFPVSDNNAPIDINSDNETNIHIKEECEELAQTSECSLRRREDGDNTDDQDDLKLKNTGTPTIVDNDTVQSKQAQTIPCPEIIKESATPSCGECPKSDVQDNSSKAPSMEYESPQTVGDQSKSSPLECIGFDEDESISEILTNVAKNYFTSKILQSIEAEYAELVSENNSQDLDVLIGQPLNSSHTGASYKKEKRRNIPMGQKRQSDSVDEIALSKKKYFKLADDTASSMPKIFDIAGNGQMPQIPSKWDPGNWDSISVIVPCQDPPTKIDGITEELNSRNPETKIPLKSPCYHDNQREYAVMTEPQCPSVDPSPYSMHGTEQYIRPDDRSPNSASKILMSPPYPIAWNDTRSLSAVPSNEQAFREIMGQHEQGQSFSGARRFSCEESWPNHYREPEYDVPKHGYEQPMNTVHWNAGRLEQKDQDCSSSTRNSGSQIQAYNNQSLPTMNLPPPYGNFSPGNHQQEYLDYRLVRNFSPQEASTTFRQTSNSHLAPKQMPEQKVFYSNMSCHTSRGECRPINNLQKTVVSYPRTHFSAQNSEFEDPYTRPELQETAQNRKAQHSNNQRHVRRVPQMQYQDFRGSSNRSLGTYSQMRLPQVQQQPVPSGSRQTESGSLYRYQKVNQPAVSQTVRQKNPRLMQLLCKGTQRPAHLPASGSWSGYAQNTPQGDTSQCMPHIVDVASLL